jgi:hypothetical protein
MSLFGMTLVALLACVGLAGRQKKRLAALTLVVLGFGFIDGCGGGTTVTPPVSAMITVTGTSGGVSRTLQLTLTINH